MTDKKWADIKAVMMRDHKVVNQEVVEEEGGSIQKEIFLVEGKRGMTKFTRVTRQQINEDPMDWSNPKDWVLSGYDIVSRLEVERLNPETNTWELLDTNEVVK